jgi:hypothetical protein
LPPVNVTYISERVTVLREEIRALRSLSAQYRSQSHHTEVDESAHAMQQLRLLHLKHELCDLLKHSFRMRTEQQQPQKNPEIRTA